MTGTSKLTLPDIGLGSWQIFDRILFDDAINLLRAGVASGANLFDVGTYDHHSPRGRKPSHTDIILGQALKHAELSRDSYLLQVKVWLWGYPERGVRAQLDNTLRRVGQERADLISFGPFTDQVDLPRLLDDAAKAIDAGTARAWGFTGWPAASVLKADLIAKERGLPRPQLAQLKYGVVRRAQAEGAPYAEVFTNTEIRLQASDVLEGGVLLGNTPSRTIGADPGDVRGRIQQLVPRFAYISENFEVPAAVLAIAYAFTHPQTENVLVGISKESQLEDALAGYRLARERGPELRAALASLQADGDGRVDPAAWS